MPAAAYLIAPLLCPIVMGAMMWLMMRPKKDSSPSAPNEVARLRVELNELRRTQTGNTPHVSR